VLRACFRYSPEERLPMHEVFIAFEYMTMIGCMFIHRRVDASQWFSNGDLLLVSTSTCTVRAYEVGPQSWFMTGSEVSSAVSHIS